MRAGGGNSTVRRAAPVVAVMVVVLCSLVAAVWWTGPRMLTVVDSAGYLGAAGNIGEGKGLTTPLALSTERASPDQQVAWGDEVPLSEWPPGYPMALAALDATGLDLTAAARVVSVVGIAALAGALFAALWFGTRSTAVAVAGAALALVGHTTVTYLGPGAPLGWSGVIASERLFLPLAVGVLAACCWEPTRVVARRAQVVGVVMLVVAAVTVRYLGVAAAAAAAIAFVLEPGRGRRSRLGRAAAVLGAAIVAALLPGLVAGGTPKVVSWHAVALLEPVVDTMGAWFMVPEGWPLAVRAGLALVLVGGPVAWAGARATTSRRVAGVVRTEVVLATFVVVYLAAVVVTCLLLDAAVPPEQRILGPVQVVAYVLLLVALHDAATRVLAARTVRGAHVAGDGGARSRRRAVLVDVGVVVVAVALAWVPLTELGPGHRYLTALGRAQQAALQDAPLQAVAPGTVVFTDETSTIWTATRLPTYVLPSRVVVTSAQDNQDFADQVDQVARIVEERDGLVVVYGTGTSARADDLVARGLVVVADCDGAAVLARPDTTHREDVVGGGCVAVAPTA